MTRLAGFEIEGPPLVVIPLVLAGLLVLAMAAGRLLGRLVRRWFHPGTDATAVPHPLGAATEVPRVGVPFGVTVFVAGLLMLSPEILLRTMEIRWFRVALTIVLVASCAMVVTRVVLAGVSSYTLRRPALAPAVSFTRMAARIAIGALSVIMGLQSLGVPVTPLLTTLGIGSLAVALALQDTLANFFAGVYLLADRPVRPGDYIKLSIEGGAEGYVDSIGWRSSRLRTIAGNIVIVPNQKLSQTILTNFAVPAPDLVMTVSVRVPFEADADAVERHLLDELQKFASASPSLLTGEPVVRATNFDDVGVVFQCIARVPDFDAQARAGHAVRKLILARLKREGIAIATIRSGAPVDRRAPQVS